MNHSCQVTGFRCEPSTRQRRRPLNPCPSSYPLPVSPRRLRPGLPYEPVRANHDLQRPRRKEGAVGLGRVPEVEGPVSWLVDDLSARRAGRPPGTGPSWRRASQHGRPTAVMGSNTNGGAAGSRLVKGVTPFPTPLTVPLPPAPAPPRTRRPSRSPAGRLLPQRKITQRRGVPPGGCRT